jgi:hypothetical protein
MSLSRDKWHEVLPGDLLVATGEVLSPGWRYHPLKGVSTKTVQLNEPKPHVDCLIFRQEYAEDRDALSDTDLVPG